MKYRDNMTPEEFAKFMEEVNALDALLKSIPTIKTKPINPIMIPKRRLWCQTVLSPAIEE